MLAVPNLRGGGEYGEAWHQAGMLGRKKNSVDDLIAAAEWLIANKYTNSRRLAVSGSQTARSSRPRRWPSAPSSFAPRSSAAR